MIARHRELAPEPAQAICEVWRKVLAQTRYSAGEALSRCDGVTYHFAYTSDRSGRMEGTAWSPGRNTPPGRLAALSHLLLDYVLDTGQSNEQTIELIREHVAWLSAWKSERILMVIVRNDGTLLACPVRCEEASGPGTVARGRNDWLCHKVRHK